MSISSRRTAHNSIAAATLAMMLAAPTSAQFVNEFDDDCGLVLTPEQALLMLDLQQMGIYDPRPAPEAPLTVSFTYHVVRRSNGTGGLSQARLDEATIDANGHFGPEIQFCQPAATVYIDSDFWYGWQTGATFNGLRTINPVPGTINIYFAPVTPGLCGISAFTFSAIQAIVMNNNCTATSSNHSTFSHEVGHYFNLFHTHETAYGPECTNGSNCSTAGDLVCDTSADPRLSGVVNSSCNYTGNATPPCAGDPPYTPPTTNLMSYSTKPCRDHFTPQQHTRAVATLVNLRPELDLTLCAPSCYSDCDQSTGVGTLDIFDFLCWQGHFVIGDPYACDCDTSTGNGVCDVFDFLCFQDAFVGGCP